MFELPYDFLRLMRTFIFVWLKERVMHEGAVRRRMWDSSKAFQWA